MRRQQFLNKNTSSQEFICTAAKSQRNGAMEMVCTPIQQQSHLHDESRHEAKLDWQDQEGPDACSGCPSTHGPQWNGTQYAKARKFSNVGYILLYDDLQFRTANLAEATQDFNDTQNLIKRIAKFYNLDTISVVKVPFSKLFDNTGSPTPAISNPLFDSIVKNFTKQNIYRVVMPPFSSSLAPWLRGDYAGGVPAETRFPNTIFAVENPGTGEVENHPNIWRFLDVASAHDTNGTIAGAVYTSNLAPGGKVLLIFTSSGIDQSTAQDTQAFLPSLGVPAGDIIMLPITPSGTDFSTSTYNTIASNIASLPAGSVISHFVNNPINGSTYGPSAIAHGGIFIAANGNGSLTHVGGNLETTGVSFPVDIEFGVNTSALPRETPTADSRRFGLSDSLSDSAALNGIGLWRSNVNAFLVIESVSWLATRGLYNGSDGKLLFVGQTRFNNVVISEVQFAGDTVASFKILGESSWYYDTANVNVPGTWSILFG